MPAATELNEGRPVPAAAAGGPLLVAGTGSIGRRHLGNLQKLGRSNVVQLRRRPAPDGEPGVEHDLSAALAHRPAAALVCTPTALHVPVALAGARAGCHLFVEKPLSHDLEQVRALQAEVEARGLVALVGFQYRFHPSLRQVRRWVSEGAVGDVVWARAYWGEYLPDWHPGEDYRSGYAARRDLGGGALLTLCHPFDYLRWLFGEVASLSAETGQRSGLELDVEDTAHVVLRFASGVTGVVSLDYVQRPRTHRLEILGRKGRILWSDEDGLAHLHDTRSERLHPVDPGPGFSRNTMFLDEMRHFLRCLEGRETPACGLDDGVRALELSLAAKLSARERRAVAPSEVWG